MVEYVNARDSCAGEMREERVAGVCFEIEDTSGATTTTSRSISPLHSHPPRPARSARPIVRAVIKKSAIDRSAFLSPITGRN